MGAKCLSARQHFFVVPYSNENLTRLFQEFKAKSASEIRTKLHIKYFEDYFNELRPASIVVERRYTDHDYLEDYCSFYVRCFDKYQARCARLHFFSVEFDSEKLQAAVTEDRAPLSVEQLKQAYLGFIVVKPLPFTFIGRTCLKTYCGAGHRYYPVNRRYQVHLLGIEFGVDSLAFQEQDSVVAACATSALWSVFQKTGKLFQHSIRAPAAITRSAMKHPVREGREFPNRGLAAHEMADAIRDAGLEPEILEVNQDTLKAQSYAYLTAQIPFILLTEVFDTSKTDESGAADYKGFHAVAATGYSLGITEPKPFGGTGIVLLASSIDKLYVHDDQVGPYARIEFCASSITTKDSNGHLKVKWAMRTSMVTDDGHMGPVVFCPRSILLPLYPKIRISWERVFQEICSGWDVLLEVARKSYPKVIQNRVIWDIHLSTEHCFKAELQKFCKENATAVSSSELYKVLSAQLPRFLWHAIALDGQSRILEVLFDATDIEQGDILLRHIVHRKDLAILMGQAF